MTPFLLPRVLFKGSPNLNTTFSGLRLGRAAEDFKRKGKKGLNFNLDFDRLMINFTLFLLNKSHGQKTVCYYSES